MKTLFRPFALIFFLLMLNITCWAQWIQKGSDIDSEAAGDGLGSAVSMSADGHTMAVGGFLNDGTGVDAGHVRIYDWNGTTWIQRGNDIDAEAAGDEFGVAVSMSDDGNIVAIGAHKNEVYSGFLWVGHVRIYEWNGSAWMQRGAEINGYQNTDFTGHSISLTGNGATVAIGTAWEDRPPLAYDIGTVRVHDWNGSTWVQRGPDIDGEHDSDHAGTSVCISDNGNTVAIGAHLNDDNGASSGHVRIFDWNGSAWVQRGNDLDGEAAGDESGGTVSLSANGNIVAIGSYLNDGNGVDAGNARVYEWNGSTWVQRGNDVDGEAAGDQFGHSISLNNDGNILAVGGVLNDGNGSNSGHVRVFNWSGSAWVQNGTDLNGEAADDRFGYSINLSGDGKFLAVGAIYNDGTGINAGHVRAFSSKGVFGFVYHDLTQNCVKEPFEQGLENRTVLINPGNITVQTNEDGSWFVDSLATGSYTIVVDTSSANWTLTCPIIQNFTITNPNSLSTAPGFGFFTPNICTDPNISINAPILRRGFSNQLVYVQGCNNSEASNFMDSVYVIVELDSFITVNSASLNYTSLGNNRYQVYLADTLYPGDCVDFVFSCTVSLAVVLNSTLCMEAKLYPVDSCAFDTTPNPFPQNTTPCNTIYDWSDLIIRPDCENDTVKFTIYNTGDGDMSCFSPVRLYIDGVLTVIDSVMIPSGDSAVFCFAGNGQTLRLEADQHPLHYGNYNPNSTIENCGVGIWTPGLVNILPQDDANPINDVYCGQVTGSYDPNDKRGFPLGVGANHQISVGQGLEYVIRFQNTGTDTAFTIVIRDTLSEDLDIFTVQSGVSSDNYSFRIFGSRVLEWRFDNIMLPDSNINEPMSHGFVTFKVNQMPLLPLGTIIENSAAIYFDYNAPIFTNTSWHTLGELMLITSMNQLIEKDMGINVYPNPTTAVVTIDKGDLNDMSIILFDALGQIILQKQTQDQLTSLNLENLTSGIYLLLVSDGKQRVTYKVVKQ